MYLKLTFIFAHGKIATCFLANCLKVAAIAGFSSDTAFAHTPIMAHTDWIGIHFSVFAVVRQSEMSLTHCLIYFFTHCAIKTGLMANSLSTMLWCIDLLGSKKQAFCCDGLSFHDTVICRKSCTLKIGRIWMSVKTRFRQNNDMIYKKYMNGLFCL